MTELAIAGDASRSLVLLNLSGDSALEWDEENDAAMEAVIAQKMKEGVSFFRLKKRIIGSGAKAGKKFDTVEEAVKARAVAVKDQDFARIIAAGQASLVKRADERVEVEGARISNPAIVARSHTVAVQPRAGG